MVLECDDCEDESVSFSNMSVTVCVQCVVMGGCHCNLKMPENLDDVARIVACFETEPFVVACAIASRCVHAPHCKQFEAACIAFLRETLQGQSLLLVASCSQFEEVYAWLFLNVAMPNLETLRDFVDGDGNTARQILSICPPHDTPSHYSLERLVGNRYYWQVIRFPPLHPMFDMDGVGPLIDKYVMPLIKALV